MILLKIRSITLTLDSSPSSIPIIQKLVFSWYSTFFCIFPCVCVCVFNSVPFIWSRSSTLSWSPDNLYFGVLIVIFCLIHSIVRLAFEFSSLIIGFLSFIRQFNFSPPQCFYLLLEFYSQILDSFLPFPSTLCLCCVGHCLDIYSF